MSERRRYRAFISYSHAHEAVARQLHRVLESYELPKNDSGLESKKPVGCTPIFRDRDELSAAASLSDELIEALRLSDKLIVLCSPQSASSHWVNEEVRQFLKTHEPQDIFPVIVAGAPPRCYPPAMASALPDPIAPDFQRGKDGFEDGALKLIAGLLDVPYGQLKDRDAIRRRQRFRVLSFIATGVAVLAVLAGLASWQAIQQTRSAKALDQSARDNAARSLEALAGNARRDGRYIEARTLALLAWPNRDNSGLVMLKGVIDNLWQIPILEFPANEEGALSSVKFTPDGLHLATAWNDGTAVVWDMESGAATKRIAGSDRYYFSFAWSEDAGFLAQGSSERSDSFVTMWDMNNETQLVRFETEDGLVASVAIALDGRLLAAGIQEGFVQVWDTVSRTEVKRIVLDPPDLSSVSMSNDGGLLAIGQSLRVKVQKYPSGMDLLSLYGFDEIGTEVITFSPDGKLVAALASDMSVIVYDISQGKQVMRLEGNENLIRDIAFFPDSSRLAAGSWEGVVTVWNIESGLALAEIRGHEHEIFSIAVSPDGSRLATGAVDGVARVYALEFDDFDELFATSCHIIAGTDHGEIAGRFGAEVDRQICDEDYDPPPPPWAAAGSAVSIYRAD